MSGHRPFTELTKAFPAKRKARIAARVRGLNATMALHELRQARERSQADLARGLKVGQPAVAKLERRTDMYVSNLRRYVEALGGTLEIAARFPEATVTISNFSELGNSSAADPDDLAGQLATRGLETLKGRVQRSEARALRKLKATKGKGRAPAKARLGG